MASQCFGKQGKGILIVERRPGGDGALAQRPLTVAHQHRGIGAALKSEARPGWTPPERTVEGKVMGIERFETSAATVARHVLTVTLDSPFRLVPRFVDIRDVHHALPQFKGRLDRVGKSSSCLSGS